MSSLILGGHSFIAQLGNDSKPSETEIDDIVSTCLDHGITTFDTTYRPERIALGASLARLGRRREATVIVWNFFQNFGDSEPMGGTTAYHPSHLAELLADLQTNSLDELVVHAVGDAEADAAQEQVASEWKQNGHVKRLGVWSPGSSAPRGNFDFVVEPHNFFTQDNAEKLAHYVRNGWEVYACSPFVRGWEMDKLVSAAIQRCGLDSVTARGRVADHLLRYALFSPHVERLIVAMRRAEWIMRNLESVGQGELNETERGWLTSLS